MFNPSHSFSKFLHQLSPNGACITLQCNATLSFTTTTVHNFWPLIKSVGFNQTFQPNHYFFASDPIPPNESEFHFISLLCFSILYVSLETIAPTHCWQQIPPSRRWPRHSLNQLHIYFAIKSTSKRATTGDNAGLVRTTRESISQLFTRPPAFCEPTIGNIVAVRIPGSQWTCPAQKTRYNYESWVKLSTGIKSLSLFINTSLTPPTFTHEAVSHSIAIVLFESHTIALSSIMM